MPLTSEEKAIRKQQLLEKKAERDALVLKKKKTTVNGKLLVQNLPPKNANF